MAQPPPQQLQQQMVMVQPQPQVNQQQPPPIQQAPTSNGEEGAAGPSSSRREVNHELSPEIASKSLSALKDRKEEILSELGDIVGSAAATTATCRLPTNWGHLWNLDVKAVGHDEHAHGHGWQSTCSAKLGCGG